MAKINLAYYHNLFFNLIFLTNCNFMKNVNFKQLLSVVCLLAFGAIWAQAQVNHPGSGNEVVPSGGTLAYFDSGGPAGDYQSGESSSVTFCSSVPGEAVTLTFTFVNIETSSSGSGPSPLGCCYDYISIADANGTIYAGGCGEEAEGQDACADPNSVEDMDPANLVFTSTAADGCLTVTFNSDLSVADGGWEAELTTGAPPPVGGPDCNPPVNGVVTNVTGTSATFTWTSVNTPINDHCFNFYIGNEGFDCDENEEFIAATVCNIGVPGIITSNNPLVNVTSWNNASGAVSISVSGLQPGTFYEWNIFETCDGNPAPNIFDCSDAAFGPFQTVDDPITVTTNVTEATCPSISPGFVPDGSFTVTIGDSPTCTGTYDIVVVNGPFPLFPGGYAGVPAGTYNFANAGPGVYNLLITETTACNPVNVPYNLQVVVDEGVDSEAPVWYVTDILGNIISDNDPFTPEGGSNLVLGGVNNVLQLADYLLPEGTCNYQEQWYVYGFDNCDGLITDPNAVTANTWRFTSGGVPLPGYDLFPSTQVIVTPDGFGTYLIDVNWPSGVLGVSLNMVDAAGNGADLFADGIWLIKTLAEFNDPEVIIVGANNVTIPHCADSRTITVTVYFSNLCEQTIYQDGINFNANGTEVLNYFNGGDDVFGPFGNGQGYGYAEYFVTVSAADDGSLWSASYTDQWGNTGYADVVISVEQAAADAPAVIIAADDNLTIPYCEDATLFCYSFQIYDDCAPVDPAGVGFISDNSGLAITYADVNSQTNVGFFEACGVVSAGPYIFDITYDGQLVQPLVNIQQQQNQAPTVILPGNLNFTIPVCETSVNQTFSIQVSDDCDDLTLLEAQNWEVGIQQYLGGTPPALTLQWAYAEGYLEITANFTAANDGNLLYATFTDSDGATKTVDSEINVVSQPDQWAPVIVYPSQDINIDLDPCDDPIVPVTFYVTATDNCSDVTPVVKLNGGQIFPAAGTNNYTVNAPVGNHTVTIDAVDAAGNASSEDFHIVVTQDPAPQDNLACIAFINITLDDECFAELDPSIVFTGTWGCLTPDDFTVTVIDSNPLNGSTIDGCGTFGYSVALKDGVEGNFTICWGQIKAEDKTAPVVECPDNTSYSLTSHKEFICTDIDHILISGVQYYTTYANGQVVPGSMSAALAYILGETGRPLVWDNCGQVRVSVWDEVTESEDGCGYDVITRHFKVADRYNSNCTNAPMTDECTQQIFVRKPNIGDVHVPAAVVEIGCDETVALDADGFPAPSVTGYPTVSTAYGTYNLADTYCNLGATYVNSPAINVCANSYKIIRTWTIVDWCHPTPVTNYTQVIKVGDTEAPSIECNLVDTDWDGIGDSHPVYSTGPFDCTAAFPIPAPIVTDNCNTWNWSVAVVILVEQDVYNQWGQVTGTETVKQTIASYGPFAAGQAGPYVSGIPMSTLGAHTFCYTVTDVCGNSASLCCPFEVVDNIAPVAVCDDNLHISIGGEGYARVYAEDVDEGSHDNCSDVTIKVRRAGGVWGPWVDFDCDDVHNYVTIELMVTDAAGNTNMCWLDVLIEDKINPYCHAPHNTTRHCDDDELLHIDWTDVDQLNEVFGEAWAEDNCNATAAQISVNNNLNDCGWGTVVRTFRATDDWGLTSTNSCQQVITVYEVHNYEIKFPKDASAECGTPNPDTIAYNTLGCDLITVNVTDVPYTATSDECYKILRTYKVINWCEWDGESDPIVIGRDEDCDNNPGDENVWVLVRTTWNGNNPIYTTYVDRDNDENNTNPFIGTSRCTNLPKPNGEWANSNINTELTSVGHWQYTQVIKVYDFVAPTAVVTDYGAFCSETADCYGDVEITFTVEELCDLSVVTVEGFIDAFADGVLDGSATISGPVAIDATHASYTISGNYPLGSHSFGVHIEDGCHNITWLEIPFDVVDCKAPTPICINGLTVTLMPQPDGCCAMAIWASDFIASDIEDCTEPIKYSIHRADDVADGSEIPTPDVTGLVLDCNDDATTLIRIYSWDSAYNPYAVQPDGTIGGPNYDYCETYVLVQAWVTCPTGAVGATVAGAIATEDSEGLEGAEVQLAGSVFLDALTGTDGSYAFNNVTTGSDVTLTPHLDANPLNGVSTFDLVLISKHILGVQLLNSPYKLISADVNSSGTVTTADMIQLRKLILGVYTDFPNNTSWRFVDASYVFPDPSNPWAEEFPEVINIDGLSGDDLNNNFISAKIGDVNGSATPNVTSVEERNVNGLFALTTEDVTVKAGNQYSVSFTAADLAKIQGYQFTLTFDNAALSLSDIEYGVATEENFGMSFLNEGIITTSWNGEAADNAVLFTLIFTANTEAQLSDLIGVSSRYTVAEAYDNNGTLDVAINFTNGVVATAGFEVYQNTPNPFNGVTKIGYSLPQDANVTITIQDVTGKTLRVVNANGVKGYNAYDFNAENLATGVLYYTVSTDDFTATKKMILVK
ncbi:MAG: T9SS type A sorting domain-containing protein [Saprospiraceae bacterium]|nr:T9SS type A sorting domain-containing protein [Saprospiraceae bacterium]